VPAHSVQADFEAAVRYEGQGDFHKAEALYRQILRAAPSLAEVHCNLGVLLQRQGQLDEALECFLRALRTKRKGARIYGNLGKVLKEMGWLEEAAACFRRSAELRRLRGEPAAAIDAYERALSATPKDFSTRFYLGAALLREKKYAEAAASLRQAKAQTDDLVAFAEFMARGNPTASVTVGGKTMRFQVDRLTNNFGVDLCHIRGRLYEQEELLYCRTRLKPRGTIVDVGANTGNHLVFFAALLDPAVIFPVEPHPAAIRELRENIALNAISCVDERCLGYGAGSARGRFDLAEGIDWAQSALVPAANGAIAVAPLDELIQVPVDFLKVDVEGMEVAVLRGALGLIGRSRPHILIEAQERNAEAIRKFCGRLKYQVERKFAYDGYANYFLAPLS
jgi:FkbM family methyltransferase